MTDNIEIIDAYENNLKHIDVTIPKGKLVLFAGVSGSGKSSLAFDTIAAESAREWQESYPAFIRNRMPHYERPNAGEIRNLTPSVVVDQKSPGTNSRSTVGTAIDAAPLIRLLFSRIGTPSAGGSMAYSFNHPAGMCPECTGLGKELILREDSMFDPDKTLREGGILFSQFATGWQSYLYLSNPLLDPDKKLRDFTPEEWKILRQGADKPVKISMPSNNTGHNYIIDYEGVIPRFCRLYLKRDITKLKKSLQDEIMSHVFHGQCKACGGTGLNPNALASKINGMNISEYMSMTADDLIPAMKNINDPRGLALARQISGYLVRMSEIGIGYLSLSRRTDTLSGGEAQRLKIVRSMGSSLNNITYIFDEPTAGLHPSDAERIGRMLTGLRNKRNNILVVEHSRYMMTLADHIIELGPGAGSRGGNVVYAGGLPGLMKAGTPTAEMMNAPVKLNIHPKKWTEGFTVTNANIHNLKNINVTIPKGVLTAVTGVAGSGKSSLARHEFVSRYPEAIVIDQRPIGTSIRSTPATYTGIMDEIRRLFAHENGVSAGYFSFNSEGGCPVCKGTGQITYEMAFSEPVTVTCEECGGKRYNPQALSYKYNGLNIEQAMRLTVEEAVKFFDSAKIRGGLQSMIDVGLEYITLGQPTSTLSGGETQRLKLAGKLQQEGNIYILDEPSSGLHGKDIEKLLALFRALVSRNNTVIIIEHRPELIAGSDWVIDMGPEGGTNGGKIIFSGTPEGLLSCGESKTAHHLKRVIAGFSVIK